MISLENSGGSVKVVGILGSRLNVEEKTWISRGVDTKSYHQKIKANNLKKELNSMRGEEGTV